MAEKWQLAGYHTDVITGKRAIVAGLYATLNNSGACFKVLFADYVVTAGKTFYVTGVHIIVLSDATTNISLRYADNAALTTNPVSMDFNTPKVAAVAAGRYALWPLFGKTAPAGKYVGMFNATAAACDVDMVIFGYEA